MKGMGRLTVTYTKTGLARYQVEIRHTQLDRVQVIKGDNPDIVIQKAQAKLSQWRQMWSRKLEADRKLQERKSVIAQHDDCRRTAAERTSEAVQLMERLESTLAHTLRVDDALDWTLLKGDPEFTEPRPVRPPALDKPSTPRFPDKPLPTNWRYEPDLDIWDRLFKRRREAKIKAASTLYSEDVNAWQKAKNRLIDEYNAAVREYNATVTKQAEEFRRALATWERARQDHADAYLRRVNAVDELRRKYLDGAPEAIREYCEMVLNNSDYPDLFPKTFDMTYSPENRMLVVDYSLPAPDDLPTLVEVRYVQSRGEFAEKHLLEKERNRLYDNVLYQCALRTIHELFEADKVDALELVVFNGCVTAIDRATGNETQACVLSLQASKVEFSRINLAQIDPRACFRSLKGVGSSQLHGITPVAPIVAIDLEDKRFTQAYEVVDSLDSGDNLASMDWEDFEHLIRELFEKHFSEGGAEVRVTRASRDGGVDTVVFDPDPIRGGKIVIQAKRYTNTVGVSAVRDLYGTVVNEGATKGILVTTSNYGPDAYAFAKGKPLTLLDGGNLLHLLESQGYRARIDLMEAKLQKNGPV